MEKGELDLECPSDTQKPVFDKTLSVEKALVSFAPDAPKLIVSRLQFNYQQTVRRIYDVGTRYQHQPYVVYFGRAHGCWQAGRLIAPLNIGRLFLSNYASNSVESPPLVIQPLPTEQCPQKSEKGFTLEGVNVSAIALHQATEQISLQESVVGAFNSMKPT